MSPDKYCAFRTHRLSARLFSLLIFLFDWEKNSLRLRAIMATRRLCALSVCVIGILRIIVDTQFLVKVFFIQEMSNTFWNVGNNLSVKNAVFGKRSIAIKIFLNVLFYIQHPVLYNSQFFATMKLFFFCMSFFSNVLKKIEHVYGILKIWMPSLIRKKTFCIIR